MLRQQRGSRRVLPAGEAGERGRRFVYLYRETPVRRIVLGSILLGCAASFLDGMMASFSLGIA
jgi:hypothetical protein